MFVPFVDVVVPLQQLQQLELHLAPEAAPALQDWQAGWAVPEAGHPAGWAALEAGHLAGWAELEAEQTGCQAVLVEAGHLEEAGLPDGLAVLVVEAGQLQLPGSLAVLVEVGHPALEAEQLEEAG